MSDEKYCYTTEKQNGYFLIRFVDKPDILGRKKIESEFDELSTNNIIINCHSLQSLPNDWMRFLIKLSQILIKNNKFLKLIEVSPLLINFFRDLGVESAFKVARDLEDALRAPSNLKKKKLDINFLNPFLEATVKVLNIQAQVKCKPGKIFTKNNTDLRAGDISGLIKISADVFDGYVVISFPEATFLKIVSSMLGDEFSKIDDENKDAAGELANMIFGQAKIVLNQKGYGIKTAIPSVICGKDQILPGSSAESVIVVPFITEHGDFFVEISST